MDIDPADLADLDLQAARADVDRERCKRSFRIFFEKAFPTFEPSTTFIPNWHVDAICEHLEAAVRGEIRRLLISIPSRHMKPVRRDTPVMEKLRGCLRADEVQVGDRLLTHRGRYRTVTAVATQGLLPILTLRTARGATLHLNDEHLVRIARWPDIGWIEASKIRPGDHAFEVREGIDSQADVVTSVERGSPAECLCFTVEEDASFVAGVGRSHAGLAVHNSSITSVALLPWVWTWNPGWRGIFATYADSLSVRDSIRARAIIESPWYQQTFCGVDGWSLREDRNTQQAYANTAGGHRLALSVGGKGIGEGANGIICDDPQTTEGTPSVYSKADRDKVMRWWFETMITRVDRATKMPFCYVVMQQRLHVEDLVGSIIAKDLGYEYLCLPSEYVPSRKTITYKVDKITGQKVKFWEDPRTVEGELLFPQVIDRQELENDKKSMGTLAYEAQHGQNPKNLAHAMFKPTFWRFWRPDGRSPEDKVPRPPECLQRDVCTAVPLPDKMDQIVTTVDPTLLGPNAHDWAVVQVWGAKGADRFLLRQYRGKYGTQDLITILKEVAGVTKGGKILVEESMTGPAIIESLHAGGIQGVIAAKTQGFGGKEGRAAAIINQVEAGNVFLPDGQDFLKAFVDEHAEFPGKHDDQVDCSTYALMALMTAAGRSASMPTIAFRFDAGPGRSVIAQGGLVGASGMGGLPTGLRGGMGGKHRGGYGFDFRRRFR